MSDPWDQLILIRVSANGSAAVAIEGPDGRHSALVDGRGFSDLRELLVAADGDLQRIQQGEAIGGDRELLNPIGRPHKVIGIGLNYRPHAAESKMPIPDHPMIFPKWHVALTSPFADIPLPAESSQVDWEAELGFVFSRRCRRVAPEDAHNVVLGYVVANDVSMRDFQLHTTQFGPGKSWDRSSPLGPGVVPLGAAGGIMPDLRVVGSLNGETVQDARTTELIFSVPKLVSYLTTFMTMEPGDVVLTGTPSGVGAAADPPRFLEDGDVFEVSVEGVGTIRNRFARETTTPSRED